MTYDSNIYYSPEKFGYTTLGEIDFGESYEFDIYVVFVRNGKVFYTQDSGCSCPSPFEDTTEDDLEEITDSMAFKEILNEQSVGSAAFDADIADLVTKIHNYLMNNRPIPDGLGIPRMK
jgi:hypothetical protein